MTKILETIKKPNWRIRRRLINAILSFCAAEVVLVTISMFGWLDAGMVALAQTIVIAAFGLASSTIASYIFGAAWDDKNVMSNLGEKAFVEPEPEWRRSGYPDQQTPNNSEEPG